MSRAPKEGWASPWGQIQAVYPVIAGVIAVSTAGHGGMWVCRDRVIEMPAKYKRPSTFYPQEGTMGYCWFEEDCEVARVILSFPDLFSKLQVESAEVVWKHMDGR
jgi:hypothetical protein